MQVLSDQESGGFYASQDADYSLDDDGDYFTWTLDEVRRVLSPEESKVVELYYDVEPHGEMHHNPAKNVLWIARGFDEVGKILGRNPEDVVTTKLNAEAKLLKARAERPTPFVDKTPFRYSSLAQASRKARPKPLKIASVLWWAFSP